MARVDSVLRFGGACLASKGLDKVIVGLRYAPVAWQGIRYGQVAPLSLNQVSPQEGPLTRNILLTVPISEPGLPGPYLAYSLVQDRAGALSDTNRSTLFLDASGLPVTLLTNPVAGPNFALARAGDSITVQGRVARLAGVSVIVYKLCPLDAQGALACPADSITFLSAPDGVFNFKVELPINVVGGQRYRMQVLAVNEANQGIAAQPGLEITGI